MTKIMDKLMTKRFIIRANSSLANTVANLAKRYQKFILVLNCYDPVTNHAIHFDYPVNSEKHDVNAVAAYISDQACDLRRRGIIC